MSVSELPLPWITLALVTLAAAALAIGRLRHPDHARRCAVAVAAMATLVGLLAAGWIQGPGEGTRWIEPYAFSPWGEPRPLFALDALAGALLPFTAFVTLVVLLGSPRRQLDPRRAAATIAQLAATWAVLTTLDLSVMAVAWIMGLLPLWSTRRDPSRPRLLPPIHVVYLLGATALLVLAFGLVGVAAHRAGAVAPLSLLELPAIAGRGAIPAGILPLLLVAIAIRKGIFPFHSWIPALAQQRGPLPLALLNAPQVGAFVLVRVAIPLFPSTIVGALPLLGRVALLAVLYGALLGLAARDLRRAYGWLAVSQSALVLVGLECTTVEGITGGLTLWISVGLALTGLALAIAAVEARVGRRSLDTLGGLATRAPWLAAAFIVLGLSAVGLPGTLGFAAEGLLVHGVLESYPGIGIAIVLATAANGFTVLRAALRTFYGPLAPRVQVSDVLGRERAALVALILAVVGLGLVPQAIVSTRSPAAMELAARLARGGGEARP